MVFSCNRNSFSVLFSPDESNQEIPRDKVMKTAAQFGAFATTRWSMVLAGSQFESGDREAREALAELCRIYWRPTFSFVCRRGFSHEDAEDLTQDFFAMIMEGGWLQHAERSRGRFRSFLLKSLQNFLGHAAERKGATKRGGGLTFVSWDDWMAQAPSEAMVCEEALDSTSPERVFDQRWATTVVEQALRRLREECEAKGRLRLFETLSDYLSSEREEISYAKVAASLAVSEAMVKKQLHNLRQRYRWLLRDEVAQTVDDPVEIDDEIRHLCAALAVAK
jgi:RNA polymerase sigma factor (sigma-70 family)